jgi:hypothetical protein
MRPVLENAMPILRKPVAASIAIFFSLATLLVGCGDPHPDLKVVDPNAPFLNITVGESRLMVRELSAIGTTLGMQSYSLGVFKVDKDTLFEGRTAYIVESGVYDFDGGQTRLLQGRQLLVDRDGEVSVYTFRSGEATGFLFGLLKAAEEDTATFSDHLIALKHPLATGARWWVRPETNPWGHASFEREYLGMDTVTFGGLPRECRVYLLHGFVPVKSWVHASGVLRATLDHGFTTLVDSVHQVEESVPYRERYDLLAINPSKALLDSLVVHYREKSGWIR